MIILVIRYFLHKADHQFKVFFKIKLFILVLIEWSESLSHLFWFRSREISLRSNSVHFAFKLFETKSSNTHFISFIELVAEDSFELISEIIVRVKVFNRIVLHLWYRLIWGCCWDYFWSLQLEKRGSFFC